MAAYYFDSSALVKLYHAEIGTPKVDQIVADSTSVVRISRLSVAELTSAFAIKVRTQSITRIDAGLVLRQFQTDIVRGMLEVFSIGESAFTAADALIERYGFTLRLRTLDAVQLAVALELASRSLVDHFVAADKIICDVAQAEGLSVINPETT